MDADALLARLSQLFEKADAKEATEKEDARINAIVEAKFEALKKEQKLPEPLGKPDAIPTGTPPIPKEDAEFIRIKTDAAAAYDAKKADAEKFPFKYPANGWYTKMGEVGF